MAPFFSGFTRGIGGGGFGKRGRLPPRLKATGGTATINGDTAIHVFTSPGTFTITDPTVT